MTGPARRPNSGFHLFVSRGLPTIVFVVVASFGLSYLTQAKYDKNDRQVTNIVDPKQRYQKPEMEFNLEEEYEVINTVKYNKTDAHRK